MENQNFQKQDLDKPKSTYWKFAAVFLATIVLVGSGFFVWKRYFSLEARRQKEIQRNYELATKTINTYEEAMRQDTYGGKTPQETLNMFVDALKKGDIELASKYFLLDDTGKVNKKWIDLLNKVKQEGNLNRMANDLERYDEARKTFDPYYIFIYKNNDGTIGLQMTMMFNKYSQVWKIESL